MNKTENKNDLIIPIDVFNEKLLVGTIKDQKWFSNIHILAHPKHFSETVLAQLNEREAEDANDVSVELYEAFNPENLKKHEQRFVRLMKIEETEIGTLIYYDHEEKIVAEVYAPYELPFYIYTAIKQREDLAEVYNTDLRWVNRPLVNSDEYENISLIFAPVQLEDAHVVDIDQKAKDIRLKMNSPIGGRFARLKL